MLGLPRRHAAIPLLLAAAYTTRLPIVVVGPANLSVLRVLVLVGMVRVLMRRERVANLNAIDVLLLLWATVLLGTSVFHNSNVWTYRIGQVLGELGVYGLCRVFIQDDTDVRRLFRVLCFALAPLAVLLLLEKYNAYNFFTIIGANLPLNIRDGRVRATGPFAHAILAGTVGAICVPMALCLWRRHRVSAVVGVCTGLGILVASTSSGPIMMLTFTVIGLLLWNVRMLLSVIRWGAVAGIAVLALVMKAPVYFLIARIDIAGGSTGWYRAQLIRSSIEHFNEWWAVGTDYTRHWMASGIYANDTQTDIVNHFVAMGVAGGLPLFIAFVLVLWAAFREVGRGLQASESQSPERVFLSWTLGSMLFGEVMSFLAISPYDQSVSFFYLLLAAIGAAVPTRLAVAAQSEKVAARVGYRFRQLQGARAPAGFSRTRSITFSPRDTGPVRR